MQPNATPQQRRLSFTQWVGLAIAFSALFYLTPFFNLNRDDGYTLARIGQKSLSRRDLEHAVAIHAQLFGENYTVDAFLRDEALYAQANILGIKATASEVNDFIKSNDTLSNAIKQSELLAGGIGLSFILDAVDKKVQIDKLSSQIDKLRPTTPPTSKPSAKVNIASYKVNLPPFKVTYDEIYKYYLDHEQDYYQSVAHIQYIDIPVDHQVSMQEIELCYKQHPQFTFVPEKRSGYVLQLLTGLYEKEMLDHLAKHHDIPDHLRSRIVHEFKEQYLGDDNQNDRYLKCLFALSNNKPYTKIDNRYVILTEIKDLHQRSFDEVKQELEDYLVKQKILKAHNYISRQSVDVLFKTHPVNIIDIETSKPYPAAFEDVANKLLTLQFPRIVNYQDDKVRIYIKSLKTDRLPMFKSFIDAYETVKSDLINKKSDQYRKSITASIHKLGIKPQTTKTGTLTYDYAALLNNVDEAQIMTHIFAAPVGTELIFVLKNAVKSITSLSLSYPTPGNYQYFLDKHAYYSEQLNLYEQLGIKVYPQAFNLLKV